MNDRFRFRAKRIDNNEFAYGFLCFIFRDVCRIYCTEEDKFYDCATKTLGQCTGLKDKNGRLIYEGDIVRRTRNTDRATVNLQIEWNQRSGRYLTTDAKHRDWNFSMLSYDYEVLGNIHENPELLEDK